MWGEKTRLLLQAFLAMLCLSWLVACNPSSLNIKRSEGSRFHQREQSGEGEKDETEGRPFQLTVDESLFFEEEEAEKAAPEAKEAPQVLRSVAVASAHLAPLGAEEIQGSVTFTDFEILHPSGYRMRRTRMAYDVTGLNPHQKHAIAIYEKGDCGRYGRAAGGHFNPRNYAHGKMNERRTHSGDLGNLQADKDGRAQGESDYIYNVTLEKGKAVSIEGLAVIVHAREDDEKSQVDGKAGRRLACGVIQMQIYFAKGGVP